MKVAILYGSQHKLTNAHKPIHCNKQPAYYVRMQIVNTDLPSALMDALDAAKPREHETVLNTVRVFDAVLTKVANK